MKIKIRIWWNVRASIPGGRAVGFPPCRALTVELRSIYTARKGEEKPGGMSEKELSLSNLLLYMIADARVDILGHFRKFCIQLCQCGVVQASDVPLVVAGAVCYAGVGKAVHVFEFQHHAVPGVF